MFSSSLLNSCSRDPEILSIPCSSTCTCRSFLSTPGISALKIISELLFLTRPLINMGFVGGIAGGIAQGVLGGALLLFPHPAAKAYGVFVLVPGPGWAASVAAGAASEEFFLGCFSGEKDCVKEIKDKISSFTHRGKK
eukprot:gb/GEZN01007580.1/.p1 GENE.gb/GEZN01007580.1/~~gb/GEZN01007580.1/.p1  ORF type:complete len:138 (-),score=13.52 gb/GEZN01007580.1/:476-889(-)